MKRFIFCLGMSLSLAALAQEPNAPTTPGAQPGTVSQPQPSYVGQPGFTNSSALIRGFTNTFGAGTVTNQFTNQFSDLSLGELGPVLASLETQISQALILLGGISTSADVIPATTVPSQPPVSQSGANFGANFAVNAGRNFAVNSTRPANPPTATTPTAITGITSTLSGSVLSPTGTTNAFGARTGFGAPTGTNSLNLSPEAMRLIAILQNDLQRALPVLSALNSGVSNGTNITGLLNTVTNR